MRRTLVVLAIAGVLAGTAAAKTPYPPKAAGSGAETTGGSGVGAGLTFAPKFALATYDGEHYVIYLTPKPVSCANAIFTKPPYLTVTIVGNTPLVVGKPTPNTGSSAFVQVDFVVGATHYYAVQPKVVLVLTHVGTDTWHGHVTVPTTHYQGKTFAFSGAFAARWCGTA
jgi:hypothetical protein